MALNPGSRFGPCEIAAPIGAGGMGEVYRATDTRLRREVAIKVLPEEIAQDKDRLARFEREAQWVAFFSRGLQRVEIDGGLPQSVAVAPWGRGGSWSKSGRILLTPVGGGAVQVVDAGGGEPRPVTRVNREAGENAHYWPVWLPDGKHFLYFIRSGRRENQGVYLGQVLDDGPDETRHRVIASSSSAILAPGESGEPPMLLWVEDGALLARAFDNEGGKVFGPVTRIADGVRVLESQRGAVISASTNGTLTWASSASDITGWRGTTGVEAAPRSWTHRLRASTKRFHRRTADGFPSSWSKAGKRISGCSNPRRDGHGR